MARYMKNLKTGAIFPYNEAHVKNLFISGLKDSKLATDREPRNVMAECDKDGKVIAEDAVNEPGAVNENEDVGLESMLKEELVAYADGNGIEIDATAKKADIIDAIRTAEAAQ